MKQPISSQFKYTIDLGVEATKATFKLRKTTKDFVMHILIWVFMAIFVGVLTWDIVRDASIVIDLIIVIALALIEIFTLLMPVIIIAVQKKFLRKLDLSQFDYTITEIGKNKCIESYYKDGKIVMQNVCKMDNFVAYKSSNNYVFLVFNNFTCAIFDLNTLSIPKEDFIGYLESAVKSKLKHQK